MTGVGLVESDQSRFATRRKILSILHRLGGPLKNAAARKRVRVGDVVMTLISGYGYAYLQLVEKHREYGWFVRVLPGIHKATLPREC